jgi:bacterioferritin-associated ferredoxin
MIVCVCNALCDQRCKQVACSPASRTVGCIYRAFGCRVRCGKCVPFMQELLERAKAEQQAGAMVELPEACARP